VLCSAALRKSQFTGLVALFSKDIRQLEAVQCSTPFYKKAWWPSNTSLLRSSERLGLTGLEQLEARRIRADLIFTYIVIWSHLSRRPRLFLNF